MGEFKKFPQTIQFRFHKWKIHILMIIDKLIYLFVAYYIKMTDHLVALKLIEGKDYVDVDASVNSIKEQLKKH